MPTDPSPFPRKPFARAAEQTIVDVAAAETASITFVRTHVASQGEAFVADVLRRAARRGFVTAEVSLFSDRAFDSLDALVRAIARSLTAPGAPEDRRGLVALLDHFATAKGERAIASFDAAAARFSAFGDVASLARAYLDAAGHPRREARRIDAWLSGTELGRAEDDAIALGSLGPRTAKTALADLTRVVRALGHRGLVVVFPGGDVIPRLSDARRRDAYVVLRELVDNADGGRGMRATQVYVVGGSLLFDSPRGLASLEPLAMRVLPLGAAPSFAPHAPLVDLGAPAPASVPELRAPNDAQGELRTIVRVAHGLPPIDALAATTVGYDEIERTIDALFAHSAMSGSVFGLLSGAYGSGKTHLLLHLAERALADRRPVLRLSLEALDSDLGSPQRHLRRLLEHAALPLDGHPSILDRLGATVRSPAKLDELLAIATEIAETDGDGAAAAKRLLAHASGRKRASVVESFLSGADIADKPSQPSYRQAAYGRLLLWLAILERLTGCRGPVLLLDEAENLYRGSLGRAERRTALRSLAFYCGGAIPSACVVLAITPEALVELRREAFELLDDVAEQATVLATEDAAMLARRLRRAKPMRVPVLDHDDRMKLAEKIRKLHAKARGAVADRGFRAFADELARSDASPRAIVRRTIERLEATWWAAE